MRTKAEMLSDLTLMLKDVLVAKTKGFPYARMARAHGYVDGYMKALLDIGIATQKELLVLVADQRRAVHGPALRETPASSDREAAA